MPPSINNRPAVDVSFAEPVLAGWGHLVVESSFSSSSSTCCTSATRTAECSAGSIYLGPQQCAGKSVLADLRNVDPPIRAIVNCTSKYPNYHESHDVQYCRVPVDDDSSANILLYLDVTARFIHHHLISKGHSILVHCQMGVSRSATIVIAYLMKYHGMSRDDAYKYVKERRPRINPNPGFWEQLLINERRLLLEKANPTNASDQPSIAFDHAWAEKSMVQYQAIGHILEDKTELFPEISAAADPHVALSAALDCIFGRGVPEDDLKWLRSLCSVLSTVVVTCSPDEIIDKMLSGEDESEFAENWRGEITTRDIERIHESTHGT